MPTPLTSLVDEPATTAEFNFMTTWQHISADDRLRLVRLGAMDRYYSVSGGYVQFDATLYRRPKLRVIVKLMADDTYAVEVGRLKRRGGDVVYSVVDQDRGLYAYQVGAVMEAMVEQAWASSL